MHVCCLCDSYCTLQLTGIVLVDQSQISQSEAGVMLHPLVLHYWISEPTQVSRWRILCLHIVLYGDCLVMHLVEVTELVRYKEINTLIIRKSLVADSIVKFTKQNSLSSPQRLYVLCYCRELMSVDDKVVITSSPVLSATCAFQVATWQQYGFRWEAEINEVCVDKYLWYFTKFTTTGHK